VKPEMRPEDIHLVLSAKSRILKCYGPDGKERWRIPARAEGIAGPGWTMPQGDTPPGLWRLDELIRTDPQEGVRVYEVYGPAFFTMWDMEGQERSLGRAGIGLHGGRDRSPGRASGSGDELAPTQGCIRVDNEDLMTRVVPAWRYVRARGGTVWLTVAWKP